MGLMAQNALLPAMREELAIARTCLAQDGGGPREAFFVEALDGWVAGDWWHAVRALEAAIRLHPHDRLAIKAGAQRPLHAGATPPACAPTWRRCCHAGRRRCRTTATSSAATPSRWRRPATTARAEAAGRRAVELERRDAWGLHAVGHVMEMEGRAREGLAWFDAHRAEHAHCNNFDYHIWWHRALFELELGRNRCRPGALRRPHPARAHRRLPPTSPTAPRCSGGWRRRGSTSATGGRNWPTAPRVIAATMRWCSPTPITCWPCPVPVGTNAADAMVASARAAAAESPDDPAGAAGGRRPAAHGGGPRCRPG